MVDSRRKGKDANFYNCERSLKIAKIVTMLWENREQAVALKEKWERKSESVEMKINTMITNILTLKTLLRSAVDSS